MTGAVEQGEGPPRSGAPPPTLSRPRRARLSSPARPALSVVLPACAAARPRRARWRAATTLLPSRHWQGRGWPHRGCKCGRGGGTGGGEARGGVHVRGLWGSDAALAWRPHRLWGERGGAGMVTVAWLSGGEEGDSVPAAVAPSRRWGAAGCHRLARQK